MTFDYLQGQRIDRFVLQEKLGEGSFGTVFSARDIDSGKLFAAKLEEKEGGTIPSLFQEFLCYKHLHKSRRIQGIPQVYMYIELEWFGVMIMDKVGVRIDTDRIGRGISLPIESVLRIAYQSLKILEQVHDRGLIHGDLKPNNILRGCTKNAPYLYIVDFGLAKSFYQDGTHKHIEMKVDKEADGPIMYATVNTHDQLTQSRRDDLEMLGYSLVKLFRGSLPWSKLYDAEFKAEGTMSSDWYLTALSRAYSKIGDLKRNFPAERLCENMPEVFERYMKYVRGLEFKEKPCYQYFYDQFLATADQLGFDITTDWRHEEGSFACNDEHERKTRSTRQ